MVDHWLPFPTAQRPPVNPEQLQSRAALEDRKKSLQTMASLKNISKVQKLNIFFSVLLIFNSSWDNHPLIATGGHNF
jgi:hypothetical protein